MIGNVLSRLVDRDLLSRLQDTLARSARLSVSICDPDGTVFTQSLRDKNDPHVIATAHRLFLAEGVVKAALSKDYPRGVLKVRGGGGSHMLVAPIVLGEALIGAAVAGPIWSKRPEAAAVHEMLALAGGPGKPSAKQVAAATVATRGALADAREMLAALSLVTTQIAEEHERQDRSIRTLSTLNHIGRAVSSQLGLEQVLQEVLDSALSFLGAESGSIMLKDESGTTMRILVARGLSAEIIASAVVRVGEGISGLVAQEGTPRLLHAGVRESDTRLKRGSAYQSAMCVPLAVRGEVIGVLNVKGRHDGGDFSDEDLSLLSVMAAHASGAIANARLYHDSQRRATELSALYSIGTAISTELERNPVLQKVLDHAIELLHARKGSVMLREEEDLHIEVASGLSEEIISSVRLRLGEGIAGKVAQEGRPRLLLKGVADTESRSQGREYHSALCVPLIVRENVIGVINISDRRDDGNFTEKDLELLGMLANQAAIAIENARLHDELHELFVSSITALANAIDARDPYTRGHSERVAVYSVRIGERLGLDGKDLDFLRYAALLHDVGKISIKEEILNKPGRLTDDEFQTMKKHPEYGAAIMMPVKAFRRIIPSMYYHHEKYCMGGGYPHGLQGEDIPLEARIISVADSYDAMTSHRPYRRALSIEQAVGELLKYSGTQFDPNIVDVFLQILEDDPDFAKAGIEASVQSESEGWLRKSQEGVFITPGGHLVCPSPSANVPGPMSQS